MLLLVSTQLMHQPLVFWFQSLQQATKSQLSLATLTLISVFLRKSNLPSMNYLNFVQEAQFVVRHCDMTVDKDGGRVYCPKGGAVLHH